MDPNASVLAGVVHEFFVRPVTENQGYNPVNTLFYGVIFLAAVWLFARFFEKIGKKVDRGFVAAWVVWTLAAAAIRAAGDQGVYPREIIATPGIDAVMLVLGLGGIGIALVLEKTRKVDFALSWGCTGALLLLYHLSLLEYTNTRGLLMVASLFLGTATILASISGIAGWPPRDYLLVALAHSWDAVNTLVAVEFFGAWEQHFLSRAIIGVSPWLFVPVKIVVAILAVWCIDNLFEKQHDKRFWMLAIATLGIATGTRNFFQLLSW